MENIEKFFRLLLWWRIGWRSSRITTLLWPKWLQYTIEKKTVNCIAFSAQHQFGGWIIFSCRFFTQNYAEPFWGEKGLAAPLGYWNHCRLGVKLIHWRASNFLRNNMAYFFSISSNSLFVWQEECENKAKDKSFHSFQIVPLTNETKPLVLH